MYADRVQAILRCLYVMFFVVVLVGIVFSSWKRYAYFHHLPQVDLPYIKIPLHTVIKLTPKAYGCDEERYTLPIEAVDTHRPKPKAPSPTVQIKTARQYFVDGGTEPAVVPAVRIGNGPSV